MVNLFRKIILLAVVFGFVYITTAAATGTWIKDSKDSDYDGLNDDDEVKTGTDPSNPDSDRDGVGDGEEEEAGTDPSDPDSDHDGDKDGDEDNDCDNVIDKDEDTDKDGVRNSIEEKNREINKDDPDSNNDDKGDGYDKDDNGETYHDISKHESQCPRSIPEFPTVALPIAAVIGLMVFFQYKKRK